MNKKGDHQEALFEYPERASLGRVVPKNRLYDTGKPGRRVRGQMTKKVARVTWQYKLAPETINLSASHDVPEIQIFSVTLKQPGIEDNLPEDILRCIDQAIGFPIIFELAAICEDSDKFNQIRVAAAYKRPSEAESGKWVVSDYFSTDWLPVDTPRSPLPVATDLPGLYKQILHKLIPVPARKGESLEDLVERHRHISVKQREYRRMEARVHREKQFNRKVELNRQLRELKADLDALTS